jgi:chromosome segregation ATPase
MKKSDPTGSGATIEYPETRPSGNFPFGGFWATVGTSAFDGVSLQGATYQDRQNVGAAVLNLINGPGRIFLADKLHIIGEIISLNGRIELNGMSAGSALGTIPANSRDNGHLYIATKVMEKPMQELWGSVMQKTTSVQDAEAIKPLIEESLTQLYEEQLNLQNLIAGMPTETDLSRQTNMVDGLANELSRYVTDRDRLQNEINTVSNELATMNNLANEANQLQMVVNNTGLLLNQKLNDLRNVSNEFRATAHDEAMSIQAEYRNATNRLQAVQITLSRLQSISNGGAISGMEELLQKRRLEVDTANGNLSNASRLLQQMTNAYDNGAAQVEQSRQKIAELTEQVQNLQAAYEQASSFSNSVLSLSDNDLIKVFADHIDRCLIELEALYFAALRSYSDELTANTSAMLEPVNSSDVADYNEYMEALQDVSDAFTSDEITLLNMIGEFGYSRNYVPGAGRVYALTGMGPTDRRRAFRTMIEEILTLGETTPKGGFFDSDSPLLKLELALKRDDKDLRELAQLIEFLTDRRPDIQYD